MYNMIEKRQDLVTNTFADNLTKNFMKNKVYEADLMLLTRDLMKFFDSGIASVTTNSKGLFEYTINALKSLVSTGNTGSG